MISTWLLNWQIDQEKPSVKFSPHDDTITYAQFSENEQSFVLFEGFLFDRHNFKADITSTDATRVIEYYKIFGEDFFPKIRGAFSLIIWDADRSRLIAGRDHMGQIPFYYYWDNTRIFISSDMRTLLNRPEIATDINQLIIAEQIMNRYSGYQRTETFYKNIQKIPPAHYLKLENSFLASYRFWDPVPPGFKWATSEEAQTFPEVFRKAVKRTLDVGADSIALSGGFDSVSIAVMASELLQPKNQSPLHGISLRFEDPETDEGSVQTAVAQTLQMPQTIRNFSDGVLNNSILQASLDMSNISPIPVINIWQSLFTGLMNIANQSNLKKILMGTGGDEMFIVDVSWAFDLFSTLKFHKLAYFYRTIAAASPLPWQRVARILFWDYTMKPTIFQVAKKNLGDLGPILRRAIYKNKSLLPIWLSDNNKQLANELEYRLSTPLLIERTAGEGKYIQTLRRLPQSPLLMIETEQAYFRAKNSGFCLLYPYYDLDLMDLALRTAPEHLLAGGLAKAPIRKLVHEKLPSVQLPFKKVDFTQTAHRLLRSEGKKAWMNLGNSLELSKLGIINEIKLNELMDSYFKKSNDNWIFAWQIISTEAWLRLYHQ